MIDSHCHLDDPAIDFEMAVERAQQAGANGAVIPSYGPSRWNRQTELLTKPNTRFALWGGFGIHPWALESGQSAEFYQTCLEAGWQQHAQSWGSRLVAIGEFGLDRSPTRRNIPFELQQEVFKSHLNLARQRRLPVILHLVRSDGAARQLLECQPPPTGGVIHGFSSHSQTVASYLSFGLMLGFGVGLLRTPKVREALKVTPLERVLFETDTSPELLGEIVIAASQILGKSVEYLRAQHSENCAQVFGLAENGISIKPDPQGDE